MSSATLDLARIGDALRYAAPLFVLTVGAADCGAFRDSPLAGCELPCHADVAVVERALAGLRDRLAAYGVADLARDTTNRYAAELSASLDPTIRSLSAWLAPLCAKRRSHQPLSAVLFAPGTPPRTDSALDAQSPIALRHGAWRYIGVASMLAPSRRMLSHPLHVMLIATLFVVGLWTTLLSVSGIAATRDLARSVRVVRELRAAANATVRIRSLLALQREIVHGESNVGSSRWSDYVGLNHDRRTLAALWPAYANTSRREVIAPIQQSLERELTALISPQPRQADNQSVQRIAGNRDTLKSYLMMAEPARVDASYLASSLAARWRTQAQLTDGEKADIANRLADFYANHLSVHAELRIEPRASLIATARQTLLLAMGAQTSEDTIYARVLDSVNGQYPDETLVSLTSGTDPRGVLHASSTVPGNFTRRAYEERIATAIEAASRHDAPVTDWVLNGTRRANASEMRTGQESIQAVLTARYFTDYAQHWQHFMNTLQWDAAATLPIAIAQLKLISDAQQSPVIALLKSLEYQGGAGRSRESLSDTLVTKAQNLFGAKQRRSDGLTETSRYATSGPLDATFGPVLRLIAQDDAALSANGDVSLSRFIERVTALRLTLQQITDGPDADANARRIAQAWFQGRSSPLAESQTYAQLVAASVGAQWSGMGDALFVHPVARAAQLALQPAQASLNDAWRRTILSAWNRAFVGRYPFSPTANDASLPELARFIRPQGGVIATFLATQLAGVIELQGDQWLPVAGDATLAFDPAFLKAVNTLQRVSAHLLAQGEPIYRFELRPVPTPGVTDTLLTLDGQTLHHYNQPETWHSLTWPSRDLQTPGTRLQWQTEHAGTSKNVEYAGRWAFVRMLERARVEPIDGATYQLTWQASPDTPGHPFHDELAPQSTEGQIESAEPDDVPLIARGPLATAPTELAFPLTYLMRTEVGQGPLELLALRGFVMPSRIFSTASNGSNASEARPGERTQTAGPPPLPKAVIDAARHIDVPLPAGQPL
ncbi:ImcF-related family protein [Paraburkholderia sp.]|uniref:ImcF-related family protein n=1 Tax=Paraburkholderia sp. TaxID=1926495 RepID=UPI00239056F8|nr:ImcF-related family protein [Paraburkholderia sp.]MDE1180313.1 ImcF-related family protein [Paraburkholderia sp.]